LSVRVNCAGPAAPGWGQAFEQTGPKPRCVCALWLSTIAYSNCDRHSAFAWSYLNVPLYGLVAHFLTTFCS